MTGTVTIKAGEILDGDTVELDLAFDEITWNGSAAGLYTPTLSFDLIGVDADNYDLSSCSIDIPGRILLPGQYILSVYLSLSVYHTLTDTALHPGCVNL
jgi:hypothetical protein